MQSKTMLLMLLAGLMCVPVADSLSNNEATAGPKRENRHERRKERRENRKERREDRKENRKDRKDDRKDDRKEDRKENRKDRRETRRENRTERRKNWREKRRKVRRNRRAWAKGARATWVTKRVRRRRMARAAFVNRWGTAHKIPAAKAELSVHAWREARFERMRFLAEEAKDEPLLKKIDDLEDKEDDRHDTKMQAVAPAEEAEAAEEK